MEARLTCVGHTRIAIEISCYVLSLETEIPLVGVVLTYCCNKVYHALKCSCNSTRPLASRFQRLFSFVIDSFCTAEEVFHAFHENSMLSMFHLPLSDQAYQELLSVNSLLQDLEIDPQASDRWVWSKDAKTYTAKRYYIHIHNTITPNPLLN